MIQSKKIEKLVQLAIAEGNDISTVSDGWSKVKQVVHMRKPVGELARKNAESQGLRHWSSTPTPHDKASEGFTDDVENVSVSFPQ